MEQGDKRVLEAEDLRAGYDGHEVLRGLSVQLCRGEFWGILGPNGSGKSTLLKVLTGVLAPWSGSVRLMGRELAAWNRREIARRVAVIPQWAEMPFEFTVWEIVMMGRTAHLGRFQAEGRHDFETVRQALDRTATAELRGRFLGELSGGERQRVIIARALAQEPEILLLDEPTTYLDLGHQIEIFSLLRELNGHEGLTVACISHDLNLAAEYCERLTLLAEGRIFAEGPAQEVVTKPNIEALYGTEVLVDAHPTSKRPRVTPVPS